MRKSEYLSSKSVIDFIAWIEPMLDTPQSFAHEYFHNKKKKTYKFDNIFSAYKSYDWAWERTIEELAENLTKSVDESNENTCQKVCYDILNWGGVLNAGNKNRIVQLAPNLCHYLRVVRDRFDMDFTSNGYFFKGFQMTSGFSKIYSALLDNYIIYDSRVGAALGLLVREYCINSGLFAIPRELCFAWTSGRGKQIRNPSCDKYAFPKLRIYKEYEYLENNIRANWLLSAVAKSTKSKFSDVKASLRLRTLEQALFMIGYDLTGYQNIKLLD